MNITSDKQGSLTIVTMSGRLDAAGAAEVETNCKSLLEAGNAQQLLDLANVEYISSAGLRSLLVAAKQVKAANGKLVLCNLTPMVREVMEISGFDKILLLADNIDAAKTHFANA